MRCIEIEEVNLLMKIKRVLNWYMRCIEIRELHHCKMLHLSWTDTWDVLKSVNPSVFACMISLELIHEMYWNSCVKLIKSSFLKSLNWYMRCIEIKIEYCSYKLHFDLNWYMRCIEIALMNVIMKFIVTWTDTWDVLK